MHLGVAEDEVHLHEDEHGGEGRDNQGIRVAIAVLFVPSHHTDDENQAVVDESEQAEH